MAHSKTRDLKRLMSGFRMLDKLYETAPMKSATTDAFPATYSDRVRGSISALRVCDASLFPIVPCANTNVPTLMTAENIADAILEAQTPST